MEEMEIDPRIKIIAIIAILMFIISGLPLKIIKDTVFPVQIQENNSSNLSNVITIYETIEVLVTPTPDGQLYFAGEYQEGIRKIKRPFSWIREDVSGNKDMAVHVTVYDYKIFNSYHWFNPSDYLYYEQFPSNKTNTKFVFVFINLYMDDIQENDPRMWIPNEQHYGLQILNNMYMPIDFVKQIRIKELEDTYNYNDDSRVGYYSAYKYYSSSSEFAPTAGETYANQTWLRGGKSNAIDGYLVYEVPKEAKEEDMILSGNFFTFGDASWKLKVKEEYRL